MFNPAASVQLSQIRNLQHLLVSYVRFILVLLYVPGFSAAFTTLTQYTFYKYIAEVRIWVRNFVDFLNSLAALDYFLLFVRVDVTLTHFPFYTLHKCLFEHLRNARLAYSIVILVPLRTIYFYLAKLAVLFLLKSKNISMLASSIIIISAIHVFNYSSRKRARRWFNLVF